MANTDTLTATDSNFEDEVLQADLPVLVDFWAEWCGPCKMVGPLVDSLATEYQGKLKVMKLDVDENPEIATRFNVRSIPTLMVFKDGELKETALGVRPKAVLQKLVDPYL